MRWLWYMNHKQLETHVCILSTVATVYPKKYAHGFCFAVLCCGYTLTDFPISIRLTSLALCAPVPAKQPLWIWINTSCEFVMNDCITTTKQSTTKPCAYFLGYTVLMPWIAPGTNAPGYQYPHCWLNIFLYQTSFIQEYHSYRKQYQKMKSHFEKKNT